MVVWGERLACGLGVDALSVPVPLRFGVLISPIRFGHSLPHSPVFVKSGDRVSEPIPGIGAPYRPGPFLGRFKS